MIRGKQKQAGAGGNSGLLSCRLAPTQQRSFAPLAAWAIAWSLAVANWAAAAPQQESSPRGKPVEKPTPEKHDASVHLQMRNVKYRFADNAAVQIKTLMGALVATAGHDFPVVDDKNSFRVRVDAAEVSIDPVSLSNIFNSYVFARPNSPLGGISISIEKGQLKIRGRLRDKGDVPFETTGTLSTTPEGRVRLHSEKMKALHMPVTGLMDALGIEIDDLIKNGKVSGVQVAENDLILDLQQVLPAPHIEGSAASIRVDGGMIATTFGDSAAKRAATLPSGNFMVFQGNRLQFGKLTMENCDLTLSDMDPGDPMDFFLDHYTEQLAPGYTKISTQFQLHVFVKDYDKIGRSKPSRTASE
jgi:hypothetical protein